MFEWLFKNQKGDLVDMLDIIAVSMSKIQLAKLAEEKAINMIANAIAKSEIVLSNGHERRRDREYYRLNIRPNDNQTGTDFWYQVIRRLLRDGDVLIVRLNNGMYYLVDNYNSTNYVLYQKVYSNVTITDGHDTVSLSRPFMSDDVIHLHYGNGKLRLFRDNVLNAYNDAINAVNQMVTVAGTPRFKYKVAANMSFRKKNAEGKDVVLTIDQVMADLKEKLADKDITIIRETEGTSLEYMDMKSNIPSNELKALASEINDQCAMAFDIPIDVFNGKITEKSDATNEFITYAVQPVAEVISDSLNAKLVGEKDYIKGERAFVWLARFKHIDVIDAANSLDKLRGIGYNFDEIREMTGYEALNTEWSQARALTKNYSTESLGEGTEPTGSADDPAEESGNIRNKSTSKHKERRKKRYEGTEKVLQPGGEQ